MSRKKKRTDGHVVDLTMRAAAGMAGLLALAACDRPTALAPRPPLAPPEMRSSVDDPNDGAAPAEAVPSAPPSELGASPLVEESVALATVVGGLRRLGIGERDIGLYAADLGWSFRHGDDLWVMFGDSWSDSWGTSLLETADDALGKISLHDFPDGDAVERWLLENRPPVGIPGWVGAAPPIHIALDPSMRATPIRQLSDGLLLTSAPGLTPIAGFSNARRDGTLGAFGIFLRNQPVACSASGRCADGFSCDAALGRCAPIDDLSATCVLGTRTCTCVADESPHGLCQDRGSSLYDPESERGRSGAVVMRQQVGNALHGLETIFTSQPWDTHRFFNATVNTVDDFDARRPFGVGNRYVQADGIDPAREGLFVWGRPGFGGIGREGRDAQLYLAHVPLPSYDPTGRFSWEPRYFAGLDAAGVPRFSARESDAVPLDLDASLEGAQPEEPLDIVGQMSIVWLPAFQRFAMFYGGDLGEQFLSLIFGPDRTMVARDRLGAIYVRYAAHPWGPWTLPAPLFVAGDPESGPLGQYGPGGILHDPGCQGPICAPSEPALLGERGRLYGPSIIEPWTEQRGDGVVDLYWHVSTWNPYQVILMRTRLSAPR